MSPDFGRPLADYTSEEIGHFTLESRILGLFLLCKELDRLGEKGLHYWGDLNVKNICVFVDEKGMPILKSIDHGGLRDSDSPYITYREKYLPVELLKKMYKYGEKNINELKSTSGGALDVYQLSFIIAKWFPEIAEKNEERVIQISTRTKGVFQQETIKNYGIKFKPLSKPDIKGSKGSVLELLHYTYKDYKEFPMCRVVVWLWETLLQDCSKAIREELKGYIDDDIDEYMKLNGLISEATNSSPAP